MFLMSRVGMEGRGGEIGSQESGVRRLWNESAIVEGLVHMQSPDAWKVADFIESTILSSV